MDREKFSTLFLVSGNTVVIVAEATVRFTTLSARNRDYFNHTKKINVFCA